jgi:hypothetical protein
MFDRQAIEAAVQAWRTMAGFAAAAGDTLEQPSHEWRAYELQ